MSPVSSTRIKITLYVDKALCGIQYFNSVVRPLSNIKIGKGLTGILTRMSLFRTIAGQETFPNYIKSKLLFIGSVMRGGCFPESKYLRMLTL